MSQRIKKELFSIQVLQVVDACLIWAAFLVADWMRAPIRSLFNLSNVEGDGLPQMIWVVYVLVPLTPLILDRMSFYQGLRNREVAQSCQRLFQGIFFAGVFVGILTVFAKIGEPRRLILISGFFCCFVFILIRDRLTTYILGIRMKGDGFGEHVIVAGRPEEVSKFCGKLSDEEGEIRIVGQFDLEKGTIEALCKMIGVTAAQRVIVLSEHADFSRIAQLVEACEVQGVEAWIGASLLPTKIARPSFDSIGGEGMLVFRSTPDFSWQMVAKNVIDRVGAFCVLVASLPFWVLAFIGIKIASPGAPVFFKQERAGLYGKKFWIWKFRTMIPEAEKLLEKVKQEIGNEVDGPAFKLEEDPRIFKFGAFLRQYSIDELPQLINVLKGEMSLVGPRPLPVHEIEAMSKSAHRRRLSMKPGLTCLWQISGRSEITDFEEWVNLDTCYIDNWSIWEDLRILTKTIPAVLFGKGAK
ncbi:MAG: sugar transferase [Akkermansiaceae bacterium]